jgi:hypothetical protein
MKSCVYCGIGGKMTRDHVPPKCYFPDPAPNIQRVTVPCCEACRVAGQRDEAPARNLMISCLEAESHPVVQDQIASRRNRSFHLDRTQFDQLVERMVPITITQGGRHLGTAPGFNLDCPLMDNFLHRVTRALVHEERNTGYVASTIQWKLNPPPEALQGFAQLGKSRLVGDVFAYSVIFSPATPTSFWLLTFYERLNFLVNFKSLMP